MADQPNPSSEQPASGSPDTVPADSSATANQPPAPHPGAQDMPPWKVDELPKPPVFTWRHWTMLLGPGLLMGGAAIGGGEWLTGPIVTARYGGAMLWLATLSVLGQVIYNIEISRYTLYTGEPIFTGKFRTIPGPKFWIIAYLLLDFGSFFPYLASSAAVPLFTAITGELPFVSDDPTVADDEATLQWIGIAIFLSSMIPLIFGGKIYDSLKYIMSFKIVAVMGFLTIVAIFYSTMDTWVEIGTGFFKFGTVPVKTVEDVNGNGVLDPGEDWDNDDHPDVIEPSLQAIVVKEASDDTTPTRFQLTGADGAVQKFSLDALPLKVSVDTDGDGKPEGPYEISQTDVDRKFLDLDRDGTQDGDNVDNIFTAAATGRDLPPIDWSLVAFLSALVAISGSGGLSNTPVSNYTRDQGWGMGKHVGAIPGMVGGHDLALSHSGTVFHPTEESMPRWKGWYRHIMRDQLAVWMPACFLGLALPSMLSVQFLARGTTTDNKWEASVMTAGALRDAVGEGLGEVFWFCTLLCGFLVLAPSMAVSADGIIRRWVDAFWTASAKLRTLDPKAIKQVYFGVVVVYVAFGLTMLSLGKPETLLLIATTIYNFALGLSCWHVLWVTIALLPAQLRPSWPVRIGMFSAGAFFLFIATVSTLQRFVWS